MKKKFSHLAIFMAKFLLAFTNNENSKMSYYISINTLLNHNKNLINTFICLIQSAGLNSEVCVTCLWHRIYQLKTERFLLLLRTNKLWKMSIECSMEIKAVKFFLRIVKESSFNVVSCVYVQKIFRMLISIVLYLNRRLAWNPPFSVRWPFV